MELVPRPSMMEVRYEYSAAADSWTCYLGVNRVRYIDCLSLAAGRTRDEAHSKALLALIQLRDEITTYVATMPDSRDYNGSLVKEKGGSDQPGTE